MLKKLKNTIEKVKECEDFANWKSEHQEGYLVSAFYNNKIGEWQTHYYDPANDVMAVFNIENDVISIDSDEIFRKEKTKINELRLEDIKIESVDELIKKLVDEKYNSEEEANKIIIIQQKEFPVWNVTYVTKALNVLNVRINAITGEIIEEHFESIMNFKK
ncbi:hypothetical protein HOA59_03255 [archaeon]|jgi:hypothetical protein|nr:hypothetical protein [archaeon]MBT6824425.1 hypothetical protein [archaeon]MBT7107296.1 hypothetical protein [archaeon]MBT7297401.1 hypothetical protein [archaeon]